MSEMSLTWMSGGQLQQRSAPLGPARRRSAAAVVGGGQLDSSKVSSNM